MLSCIVVSVFKPALSVCESLGPPRRVDLALHEVGLDALADGDGFVAVDLDMYAYTCTQTYHVLLYHMVTSYIITLCDIM